VTIEVVVTSSVVVRTGGGIVASVAVSEIVVRTGGVKVGRVVGEVIEINVEVSVDNCVVVIIRGGIVTVEMGVSVSTFVVGRLEVLVTSGEVKGIVEEISVVVISGIKLVVVRLLNSVVVMTGGGDVTVDKLSVVVKVLSVVVDENELEAKVSVVVSKGSENVDGTCVDVSGAVVVKIGSVIGTVDGET
jgi:hypothetical protein